ncbi:MAG: hypothetical protein LC754_03740 [Acidobacteria bacterium]|nr:hypothetical protein [Acidobacteriota bacterium]
MRSSSTAKFCKLITCPSTEALRLHSEAVMAVGRQNSIARHLATCDFCGAEMQLLAKFPPHECAVSFNPCEMPLPLRLLAEDLLAAPALDRARFAEAIYEIERLTLTDA